VRQADGTEEWKLGGFIYDSDSDGDGYSGPITSEEFQTMSFTQPSGSIDNGVWHHIVVVRAPPYSRIYIDGVLKKQESRSVLPLNHTEITDFCFGRWMEHLPNTQYKGKFDRMRIYERDLSSAEVIALYHQDIDRDGLWDISENKSLLWRDTNGDGVRIDSESSYSINPFRYDSPNSDHDDDGLFSLDEQNTHGTDMSNPDSDKDLMPDRWEAENGLNPIVNDANLDADLDGLFNFQEFIYKSNAQLANTDGASGMDSTNDKQEVDQGSNPHDDSDGGQPIPADEQLTIKIGVGDKSGSESEDYVMNIFRIDPETGDEEPFYTLRSGGHGQYTEKTLSIFKKSDTYTFQIDWQSSNLASSTDPSNPDGADFDYTFIVEPQNEDPALSIVDSVSSDFGQAAVAGPPVLGEKSDVVQFKQINEKARVIRNPSRLDLWIDSNMNGLLESNTTKRNNSIIFGTTGKDELAEEAESSAIIDVNNNNSDKGGQTSNTTALVDNENGTIDGGKDMTELTAGVNQDGHTFGRMSLTMIYNKNMDSTSSYGGYEVTMRFVPQPGQLLAPENVVRVFDFEDFDQDKTTPKVLLGPGRVSAILDTQKFYSEKQRRAAAATKKNVFQKRNYVIEGLTAGYAVIEVKVAKVELIGGNYVEKVAMIDTIRVTVNVDRRAQKASDVASNVDALTLRGNDPHYLGIRKPGLSTSGTRAIRGRIIARPPSHKIGSSWKTQSTWMRGRELRQSQAGSDIDSGSSLWIGLKEKQGNNLTWIQCGLRWRHDENDIKGTVPFAYIETGTHLPTTGFGPQFSRNNAAPDSSADAGQGNTAQNISALMAWEQAPLILDFVMYKIPGALDNNGADVSINHWRVIFRDARAGKNANIASNYFELSSGVAAPSSNNDAAIAEAFSNAYKSQSMKNLDIMFETNQSIAFVPGLAANPSKIFGLDSSIGLKPNIAPASRPHPTQIVNLYNWVMASFAWQDVSVNNGNLNKEFRTGKTAADGKAIDTQIHEWWRAETLPDGVKMWDTRAWGFGSTE